MPTPGRFSGTSYIYVGGGYNVIITGGISVHFLIWKEGTLQRSRVVYMAQNQKIKIRIQYILHYRYIHTVHYTWACVNARCICKCGERARPRRCLHISHPASRLQVLKHTIFSAQ